MTKIPLPDLQPTALDQITGNSPVLRQAIALARAVAAVDSTVLITGESGTGKELIAQGIHQSSPRANGPLIMINCATVSENLQNAELFGHVKGAFTGAVRDRPGLFEAAHEGTLFLDEVAELGASAQATLLRAVQEGQINRIGEYQKRKVDVRIIAATHRDLDTAMRKRAFRTDLFFRLNVVNIALPPLRERDSDTLLLAQQFIAEYNRKMNKSITGLSDEVAQAFLNYTWPGNVRELRNVIESSVLLARGEVIEIGDLPACLLKQVPSVLKTAPRMAYRLGHAEVRRKISQALVKARGNRGEAAEMLGISRSTLWRRIKDFSLDD